MPAIIPHTPIILTAKGATQVRLTIEKHAAHVRPACIWTNWR